MSGNVVSACSEMYVIMKKYAPVYKGCTQGLCTSSYGQGQIKVEDYIELRFSSVLTFFSSSSLQGFFLLNGENFRIFLLCHIFSLFCY